jgi:hypothetical protein
VIIRRPPAATLKKQQPRAHISDDITQELTSQPEEETTRSGESGSSMDVDSSSSSQNANLEEMQDELSQIRALLRPPSIPGVLDWGIPPECDEPGNPAIAVRGFSRF